MVLVVILQGLEVASDEGTCGRGQFKCINGQCNSKYSYDERCAGSCMPLEWKCDGNEGCTDGSDESLNVCGGKFIKDYVSRG